MNKLSFAALVAASAMMAGSAMAADMAMPVKAPPVVVVPPFTWTGFYLGGNIGYGWGNFDYPYSAAVYGSYSASRQSLDPEGIVGGGQIGYNYQFSNNLVIGAEADFQWADMDDDVAGTSPFYDINSAPVGSMDLAGRTKVEWFGTLRGRLGYAWDHALLYATGGAAYGSVKSDGSVSFTYSGYGLGNAPSTSDTQWGWTVGGGLEYALTDHWTIKAEYSYIDLGSQTLYSVNEPLYAGGVEVETTFSTVKAGVNYKF